MCVCSWRACARENASYLAKIDLASAPAFKSPIRVNIFVIYLSRALSLISIFPFSMHRYRNIFIEILQYNVTRRLQIILSLIGTSWSPQIKYIALQRSIESGIYQLFLPENDHIPKWRSSSKNWNTTCNFSKKKEH